MGDFNAQADVGRFLAGIEARIARIEQAAFGRSAAELQSNRDAQWVPLVLGNGFTAFGSVYAPPSYYKDSSGRLWLRGGISHPNTAGYGSGRATAALMPIGARPSYQHEVYGSPSVETHIITTLGAVSLRVFADNVPRFYLLDNINFRTT